MMKSVATIVCLATLSGCGGSQPPAPEMALGGWPELQEFSLDTLMIVGPDASQGRWAAVKQGANSEPFKKGLEKLANAPAPPGLSSHQAEKDAVVAAFKSLSAAAASGTQQELESKWKEAKAALDTLNTSISKPQ